MSDSLADILANRNFDEPDEALAIKSYVLEHIMDGAKISADSGDSKN